MANNWGNTCEWIDYCEDHRTKLAVENSCVFIHNETALPEKAAAFTAKQTAFYLL